MRVREGVIMSKKSQISRRAFLKRTAYVAPIVLSLPVVPTIAAAGSGRQEQTGSFQYSGEGRVEGHR